MSVIGDDAATQAVQLLSMLLEMMMKMENHLYERSAANIETAKTIGKIGIAGGIALGKGAVALGKGAVDLTGKIKQKMQGGELTFKDYMKSIKKGQQYDSIAVPTSALPELKKYANKLNIDFYHLNTDNNLASIAIPREKIGQMNEALKLATASIMKSNPEAVKFVESNLTAEEKEVLSDICAGRDIPNTTFTTGDGKTKTAVPAEFVDEYKDAVNEAKETMKEMQSVELAEFKESFPWDDISTMAIEIYPACAEALAEQFPDDIKIVKDGDKLYAYGDKDLREKVEAIINENMANKDKVPEADIEQFTVSTRDTVNTVRQVLFAQKTQEMKPAGDFTNESNGGMKFGILDKRKKEFAVIDRNADRGQIDDSLKAMGYKSVERAYIMSSLAKQYDKTGDLQQSITDVHQFTTTNPDLADIKSSPISDGKTAIFNPKQQGDDLFVKFCVVDANMTTVELEAGIRKELGITDKIAVAELINAFADRIKTPKELDSITHDSKKYSISQITSQCIAISEGGKSVVMPKDSIDAAKIEKAFGIKPENAQKLKSSIENSFKTKDKKPAFGTKSLNTLKKGAEKQLIQNRENKSPENIRIEKPVSAEKSR